MRRTGLLLLSTAMVLGLSGCGLPDRDDWEARLVEAAETADGVERAEVELGRTGGLGEMHTVLVRLHVDADSEAGMRRIGDAAELPIVTALQDYPQTNTGIVIALVSPEHEITRGSKSLLRALEEHGLAWEGGG